METSSSQPKLEILPDDIVLEVCKYLLCTDIIYSFIGLNCRMRRMIKQYHYQVSLYKTSFSNYNFLYKNVFPQIGSHICSLLIDRYYSVFQQELFINYFGKNTLVIFSNLERISLVSYEYNELNSILNILHNLHFLTEIRPCVLVRINLRTIRDLPSLSTAVPNVRYLDVFIQTTKIICEYSDDMNLSPFLYLTSFRFIPLMYEWQSKELFIHMPVVQQLIFFVTILDIRFIENDTGQQFNYAMYDSSDILFDPVDEITACRPQSYSNKEKLLISHALSWMFARISIMNCTDRMISPFGRVRKFIKKSPNKRYSTEGYPTTSSTSKGLDKSYKRVHPSITYVIQSYEPQNVKNRIAQTSQASTTISDKNSAKQGNSNDEAWPGYRVKHPAKQGNSNDETWPDYRVKHPAKQGNSNDQAWPDYRVKYPSRSDNYNHNGYYNIQNPPRSDNYNPNAHYNIQNPPRSDNYNPNAHYNIGNPGIPNNYNPHPHYNMQNPVGSKNYNHNAYHYMKNPVIPETNYNRNI
ncbi:unnamed protein product [Adineta steineri]|uniref:F-box domain-containing protein n=1 Tax=Adineta steineri TaxID=433720 RepID=A0A813WCB4_9BILA|nr:unnamed protein product [Adineta steineri]